METANETTLKLETLKNIESLLDTYDKRRWHTGTQKRITKHQKYCEMAVGVWRNYETT